ncbi:MAG TPA: TadE/TadG family type IV pilus assembly protein [Candidatus Binatia bacterium]|jgi:Flp pilus assembly protein TadG|nr:TadE/TadG family type IV pilus assembly protein [Candidatus Binatia bacterium]
MNDYIADKPRRITQPLRYCLTSKGQALVEFTLVFMLLLVVAWIPADFGLAFYTGQLALNASREGARIGAADPNYSAQVGSCTLPACYSLADGTILKETAKRLSSALLPGATITVSALAGATCNQSVQVQVVGDYNFSFYRFLRFFGANVPQTAPITQTTLMRWEHQNTCPVGS